MDSYRMKPNNYQNKHTSCKNSATTDFCRTDSIYHSLDHLPLAMAYVPWQSFDNLFTLDQGMEAGTAFPELCKPFLGKGGVKR